MRTQCAFLSLLLSAALNAQVRMPATTLVDIQRIQTIARHLPVPRELARGTAGCFPTAFMNGRCMVGFLGRVAPGASLPADPDILWGTRIGEILSFRVDAYHLDRVSDLSPLLYAELARTLHPELDKLVRATHADSVQLGINLPQTYTGRDVFIGVTDWGFEYAHPMFYDTAMVATRIFAAWDQSKHSGPPPSGYAYGTVHLGAADLIAEQSDTVGSWGYRDAHGTHVAGIAGGCGAGTAYRGIAFDAQFLFVSTELDQSAMLDGFAWMRDIAQAEGKRLVINMSFGRHDGNLDGTSLWTQAIDQLSDQGVVFVAAGGNDGGAPFHIGHTFAGDTLRTRAKTFGQTFGPPDEWTFGQQLLLWGEAGHAFTARVAITDNANNVLASTPWYATSTPPPPVDSVLVVGSDSTRFTFASEMAHPLNGRPMMRFALTEPPSGRKVMLQFTAADGLVHAWNDALYVHDVAGGGLELQAPVVGWTAGDDAFAIGEPTCANSVIAVGAYSSEYQTGGGSWVGGSLASFSSRGPTIDGRLKPEICAPGVNVGSSLNSQTDLAFTPIATVDFMGHTYPFARMSGTSMASPAVTGIVALLLEAAPLATPQEIKEVLMATARTDAHTGVIPPEGSDTWGMGKVNAYAAAVQLLGVAGMEERPVDGLIVWPNPAQDAVNVLLEGVPAPTLCTLLDMNGRTLAFIRTSSAAWRMDLRSFPSGLYLLRIERGERIVVRPIVKQ